jgi:hypothetical protein
VLGSHVFHLVMVRPGAVQADLDRELDEASPLLVRPRPRSLPVLAPNRVIRRRPRQVGVRPRPAAAPKAADGQIRSRGWVVTCFAGDQPDLLKAEGVFGALAPTYFVFGRETCPETSRPHLQGYLYFPNPRSKQGLLNAFFHNSNQYVYVPVLHSVGQVHSIVLRSRWVHHSHEHNSLGGCY